jgi:hypothetical protein
MMSGSKHPKVNEGDNPFPNDLGRNPGIGQTKGSFAAGGSPHEIEGDNTVEGDIGNDPNSQGGIDENRLGRTNK